MPMQNGGTVIYQTFIFDCQDCNYSSTSKSEKTWKMVVRLHKKKCKKTGRTEAMITAGTPNRQRMLREKGGCAGLGGKEFSYTDLIVE